MKVFVEDNMDMQAPRTKADRGSKAPSTRHSIRSTGFKRRKPADNLDALINSGADEEVVDSGMELPNTPPIEPVAVGGIELSPTVSTGEEEMDATIVDPFAAHENAETVPPESVIPGVEETPVDPSEEEPQERRSLVRRHNRGNHSALLEEDLDSEDDVEVPASGQNRRPILGGKRKERGPSTTGGKKAKPASDLNNKVGRKGGPNLGRKSGRDEDTKPEKPAFGRSPKAMAPAKRPKKEAPIRNPSVRNSSVVVMPESVGSQIITILEVAAGAALMFFGASQVGNILINNIIQGMLGG